MVQAQRWQRQFQLLSTILDMNEHNLKTTVKDITLYLKVNNPEIDINIIDSSIRHYRKNKLVRRKHNPYKHPFEYELSNRGFEQLVWLVDTADELLLDINKLKLIV